MRNRARALLIAAASSGLLATGLAGPEASSLDEASPGTIPETARPFDVYTGAPPTRVYSKSRVEGAHTRVEIEPVLQGDFVHHRFVIPNETGETLELRLPKMCSGCMLDSYSKRIPPGLEGNISIVIPTDALGGRTIESTITAETGSPALPRIEIDVSLTIREFAQLSPYRVWLRGRPDDEIVETCVVVPNPDYPFEITGIRARKGIWFDHTLEAIERDGRKAWEIRILNTRRKPGPYQDVLFVQTDHPERREFKIRIEGRIEE